MNGNYLKDKLIFVHKLIRIVLLKLLSINEFTQNSIKLLHNINIFTVFLKRTEHFTCCLFTK